MTYDTIIIGKGPAGISAAVYLVRSGHTVLVLGKDAGALERAESIENYYGFPETLTGAELAARGVAQAERLGAEVRAEEVVHLGMEELWSVKTDSGNHTAKTVLIATGKARAALKVPGFEESADGALVSALLATASSTGVKNLPCLAQANMPQTNTPNLPLLRLIVLCLPTARR